MSRAQVFRDDALGVSDATALATQLRRREVSALELIEAAIVRVEAVDPQVAAVAYRVFEQAPDLLKQSRNGHFQGIPAMAKENIHIRGIPLTYGSRATPIHTRRSSGALTKQLIGCGLTLLGTTTMPAFGWTACTEREGKLATRNPWDLDSSCGGSSGGSAALVASGAVPIAHGNDGGGSLRIPAASCGLVTLKATRGRVRTDKSTRYLPLDIISNGVLARSVRDVEAFFMAAESLYRNRSMPPISTVGYANCPRLRIGLALDSPLSPPTSPETRRAVGDKARLLSDLGHDIVEVDLEVRPSFTHDFMQYWSVLAMGIQYGGKGTFGRRFDARLLDPLTKGLVSFGKENLRTVPRLLHRLRTHSERYKAHFESVDVLLTPVVCHETPPIGHFSPEIPFDQHVQRLEAYAGFTAVQNVAGTPSITFPGGLSNRGLPIGVMLSANYGEDALLLALAREIESSSPFPRIDAV